MSVTVRPARPEDAAALVAMFQELAVYDGVPPPTITPEIVLRDGFGPQRRFEAVLATRTDDDVPVGVLVLLRGYATRVGAPTLIVHVLFVTESARRMGAAMALAQHAAKTAQAEGCGRIELNVLDWNEPAVRFYTKAGFRPIAHNQPMRLDAAGIQALASGATTPSTIARA